MKTLLSLTLLAIFLIGCTPDSGGKPKVAGAQRQVLDKAKAVEATVQQGAQEDRKKVDAQTE